MKRKILATLLAISLLVPTTTAFASNQRWESHYSNLTCSNEYYYIDYDGNYASGWKLIDCNYYYFYPDNHAMAYSTVIDGYYIDENGAYTESIPQGIQTILKHDSSFLNNLPAFSFNVRRENLYQMSDLIPGSIPNEDGYTYYIDSRKYSECIGAYFVPDGKDYVYSSPNQGGLPIYRVQNGVTQKLIMYEIWLF